jgi:Tfp pilus assembly protein PilW
MCPNRKFNRQAGFSMMELLISMLTMTIITGAVFALISGSIKFTNATFHMTDAEQTMRTAHEIINRDLTTAGNGLRGLGTIQVPSGFVQNYLTTSPVTSSPGYVNLSLVTSDDNVAGTTAVLQTNPAVTVRSLSDRITMLTQDTSFTPVTLLAGKIAVVSSNTNLLLTAADIGRFQVGEIYAIAAQNSAAFGVVSGVNTTTNTVVLTNGDVYGLNQTGAGTPITAVSAVVSGVSTQPASIMRIQMIHYFVNSNNLLVRRVFGVKGSPFVDSVVAEHVINFQFRYLLNLHDSNDFVVQPVGQLSSSQQQTAVREVETTIAVETVRAVNAVTNSNSNSSSTCGVPNPNGKQLVCTTTATTVRNLQFRQAL